MEARKKRFEELNISRDELNTIGEALKKEEFRDLLAEYCKEVTDPENQKLYQEEITELERQRGVDVTFINPDPGFVIKTSANGKQKAFINVSKSPNVGQPKPGNHDSRGFQWSIPYSIAPPREDFDKRKNVCMVIDVVFHPYSLYLAELRKQFRDVVVQTALDAVEQHCHVTLDRENLKFPKLNFKGFTRGAVVRKKNPNFVVSDEDKEFLSQVPNPYEDGNYFTEKKSQPASKEVNAPVTPGYTIPKFSIKYRNYVDMQDFTYDVNCKANAAIPKEVLVTIELPLLKTSSEPSLKLDIEETSISLICEKPKYKLNLTLPYSVNGNEGQANFEKDTRRLVLTLPVKLGGPFEAMKDVHLEDSGVESDPGWRVDDDSDELPSKISDLSEEYDHIQVCPSEVAEYGYRTSNKVHLTSICDNFLQEDLHYSLPHFTCNLFDNTFALTLHVKNVDETTIRHRVLSEKEGLHVTFASLGGGMFPQHYALCIRFPQGSSIDEDSVVIEAWDNNVICQFKLGQSQILPNEYYAGVDENNLKATPMTELHQAEMALNDLRNETINGVNHKMVIDVQQESAEQVIVELIPISKENSEQQPCQLSKTKPDESSSGEPKADAKDKTGGLSSPNNQHAKDVSPRNQKPHRRGLSESSGNDWVQTHNVRGILKRPSRSLSESNLDEYVLSDAPSSAIGSEECIASESCTEDHLAQKKHVRFSDHIGKRIFRVNSSILGKKSVNKLKRKKRARARRASEGDNSEGDAEHVKHKSKNKRVVFTESPQFSESTEDEEHSFKRMESSEEERDKTDKENKVKRSKKRRHVKTGGRN